MSNFYSCRFKTCISTLVLSLMLISTEACSEGDKSGGYQPEGPKTTGSKSSFPLPEGTKAVITIGPNLELNFLDANGKPLPRCMICTEELESKYGPKCEKSPEPICKSLLGVNVRNVEGITALKTTGSPACISIPLNGWAVEICF